MHSTKHYIKCNLLFCLAHAHPPPILFPHLLRSATGPLPDCDRTVTGPAAHSYLGRVHRPRMTHFQPRSGVRGEHDRLGRADSRRYLGRFGGEVSGCHSTPSVFDIWAMPEDGPPIDLQPRSGVFPRSMRLLDACLSRSRRPCSPLSRDSALRATWEGSSSSHDPFFSRAAASERSMTVSVVQAAGVAWAVFRGEVSGCHSTPSVFDIWAMPEDGPPIDLQLLSGGR